MSANPINGVEFGQEKTAAQCLARAAWEYDQASRLRATKPIGYSALVEGHERAAKAYEALARDRQSTMVETARSAVSKTKSRAQLVDVAREAAAAVFAPRKTLPDSAVQKARSAAFKAIQRYDRLAGTSDHPVAAYSHGIAELAAEATDEARQRWEAHHKNVRALKSITRSMTLNRRPKP